jgi:hypothetical protein
MVTGRISMRPSFQKTCNMIHLPLKRFEYCFAGPGAAADGMKKVSIDFEKKRLSVTGDIRPVPARSRGLWRKRSVASGEKIEVSATIYPGFTGGLTGLSTDELIFSLEGTMRDSKHVNSCSGLLVLENMAKGHDREGLEWHATLYLYDDASDGREIKLRLTMYRPLANPERN